MQPRGTASISTLLADDEQLALDELQYLLKDFPEIEIVGTASNGLTAVEMAEDLEMVGGEGKRAKVLNLIQYLERRNYLSYLVSAVRKARPEII